MRVEVHEADEWAPHVGARLVEFIGRSGTRRICLATGSTPEPAYAAFAANGGTLSRAEVFLLDEFLLPTGDPGRCDEMLSRALLDLLPEPPATLHAFDTSAPSLHEECVRFDERITAGGLDLAIVGLGRNGHIGMNEPGASADSPTRFVELHPSTQQNAARYGATTPPAGGVTVGMGPLLAAREIWLLVTGRHKAEILQRALAGPVSAEVPASYLQEHPNSVVIIDEPAAALLD